MKRLLVITFLLLVKTTVTFPQTRVSSDIVGFYLARTPTAKEKFQVEFFRASNGTYEARVVWIDNPEFRQRLESLQIRNLSFDPGTASWRNGRMVFEGNEFRVNISFTNDGRLRLRGFIGVSLFGRTMYWDRERALRQS